MSKTSYYLITTLLLTTVGLSACSADSGTEANPESKNETSAISGFWERLPERGNRYLKIDSSGEIQTYTYNDIAACWWVNSSARLTSFGDDRYFFRHNEINFGFQYFAEMFEDTHGDLILNVEQNTFSSNSSENFSVELEDNSTSLFVAGTTPGLSLHQLTLRVTAEGICPELVVDNTSLVVFRVERGFISEDISVEILLDPVQDYEPKMPPTIPGNLQAVAGSQQITLTWDTVSNASSYMIFWDTKEIEVNLKQIMDAQSDPNSSLTVQTIADNVTNPYVHTGRITNQKYFYRVAAWNEVGSRGISAETSATPNP